MSKLDSPELRAKKEMIARKFGVIQTAGDNKVCPACSEAAKSGKPIMFPLHPNCRCSSKAGVKAQVLSA